MKKHKSIYIIALFLILLNIALFTACKSKHKVIHSTSPIEEKENSELFIDIISNDLNYTTFSSRLNINITNGSKTLSSKATLRMVKDSSIQISVQPLFGVEMFRFYIDPYQVVLLDRMNKRYVEETISSLKEHYPVGFDFYTLQSMLTNSLFITGKNRVEYNDYRMLRYAQTSDLNYTITGKDHDSGIDYSFNVNGDDRIVYTQLLHNENQLSLKWSYDEFAQMTESIFPHRMMVAITTQKRKLDSELRFSGIEINEPFSISTSIPNGYRKVAISDILKIIAPHQ
ncbi:MAG TPA: DUF4292 domain-containing protein [Bacteroidales bacterium]|nr:DUF4292 domain-containing protein [Bacteroidales bacterium]